MGKCGPTVQATQARVSKQGSGISHGEGGGSLREDNSIVTHLLPKECCPIYQYHNEKPNNTHAGHNLYPFTNS